MPATQKHFLKTKAITGIKLFKTEKAHYVIRCINTHDIYFHTVEKHFINILVYFVWLLYISRFSLLSSFQFFSLLFLHTGLQHW